MEVAEKVSDTVLVGRGKGVRHRFVDSFRFRNGTDVPIRTM